MAFNPIQSSRDLLKKYSSSIGSYFNPTSNAGQNFWSTPTAQKLGQVQQTLNRPIPQQFQTPARKFVNFSNQAFQPFQRAGQGFVEASTYGLGKMKNIPESKNLLDKAAYGVGFGVGMVNPLNPINKFRIFNKVGQLGARPTQALISKLAPQATGFVARKLIPAIGSEVAQTAAYGGAKLALGQKFNPVTDLAMGIAGRGVLGKFQPDLPTSKFRMSEVARGELEEMEDRFLNPLKYVNLSDIKASSLKARNTLIKQAKEEIKKIAGDQIDMYAGKYLPHEVLRQVAGEPKKVIKALIDLSAQNKLTNIEMGFVGKNQPTKGVEVPTKIQTQPELKQTSPTMVSVGEVLQKTKPKNLIQEATLKQSKQPIAEALPDIISKEPIDVKSKVGILDYLRTPDRVLKKIGLENESKLLRTQYDKYLKQVPEEINKITAWSKQVPGESSKRIFKYLDGQDISLTPKELQVSGQIKTYLKGWADKLGLPEDKRITNYITHIFEKDFIKKEFDPEIAKLIEKRVAGSVYDPFTEQRLGKMGYVEDVWRALDAYVKRATRKVNMDVALKQVKEKAKELETSQYNYVKKYIDNVNLRPSGIDSLIDNSIKQVVGYRLGQRPVNALTRSGRQMIYRGTLGLNIGSSLKNLSQGANTYAKLGEKYTVKGYWDLLNKGTDELKQVGVLADDLIQDRNLNVKRQLIQKIDKGLFYFFETAEKINRGSAYYGAKAKALAQGMDEASAIEYGKKIVRDTQFKFGSIDTPVAMQSDIAKVLTQFQTYSMKQVEFLGEMAKNKEYAGLLRYALATTVFITTVGKLMGMEWKDIIPSFRIGIPPTLATPVEIGKSLIGVPDKYGNVPDVQERLQNVGKTLIPYIPGGTQLKKTIQGLGAYKEGASLTPTGRTRYEVPQTPLNAVKMGVFGQFSIPEGREYVSNLGKSKSQIIYEEFKKVKTPQEKAKLWDQMVAEGKINKDNISDIKKYFKDVGLKTTSQEKNIRNLPVKDGSKTRAIKKQFDKLKTPQEKAALWDSYVKKGIITKDVAEQLRTMLK